MGVAAELKTAIEGDQRVTVFNWQRRITAGCKVYTVLSTVTHGLCV